MSASDYRRCAFCDKSNASQVCTGCNGAPDSTIFSNIKTLYCNTSCQKGHWNAHKQDCKAHQARRVLHRASEMAQQAFYVFREFTYDLNIESMEDRDGSLFLYEGFYKDDRIFFPFPDHLLRRERDKQAALTFMICGEAVGYMHELFRTMLKGWSAIAHSPTMFIIRRPTHKPKGICTLICEMCIKVRPPQRPVVMIRPNGPETRDTLHVILVATLKSGEEFVIDITGAQYGFHDPLYPWHQYHEARIHTIRNVLEFGASSARYCGAEWGAEPGYRGLMRRAMQEVAVVFDRAVGEWEGKGVTVGEMLRMGEGAFERTRGEMVGYVRGVVQEFVGCHEGEKRWKMSGEDFKAMVEEGSKKMRMRIQD